MRSLVSVRKPPRFAAGRARALGLPTRGTTGPNRLRRVDRWIVGTQSARLRDAVDPLVVDLGYGQRPVTTVELASRLRDVRPDVRVLGLEIDPERVAGAASHADPPTLEFARGGFELAGRRPALVRAFNVLRQYDEAAVAGAWSAMRAQLAAGGMVVEGTCDELGRRASWVSLDATGPLTLTLAARVADLGRPGELAERLPKALIHRNVPGERVHTFLAAFDDAWAVAAPLSTFGPRQRWVAAVTRLAEQGWPVVGGKERWRLGEITVRWTAVAPGPSRSASSE
ncbi:MAG TPA: class I SAM-dependent methyltransferase [Mycobacteriales bacterium]